MRPQRCIVDGCGRMGSWQVWIRETKRHIWMCGEHHAAYPDPVSHRVDPKPRHGSTCPKALHDNPKGGYLHGPEDDGPFKDDGVTYCGRCHRFLDPAES